MNRLKTLQIQITSIAGGMQEGLNYGGEDQFLASMGIDPEFNGIWGTGIAKAGLFITPVAYTKFSSTGVDGAPMWITGAATSSGVYSYLMSGKLMAYNSSYAGEVEAGTPTSGSGNGMAAYNDYLYLATSTNITRYGRLSATGPAMSNGYWVSDLGMSALVGSVYPATRNVTYPNHVLHAHTDGRLYIADYDGRNGRIHSLTTDSDGTNGSGSYNDLTLPPGYMPTAMETFNTDLAILCCPEAQYASGDIPRSGRSALFLWDTTPGNKFYRSIPINEPMATAMKNKNGELFVLAGNIDTNVNLLKYLGGYSFQTLARFNQGAPPPAGAVDTLGNMLAWGGYFSYPSTQACAGVLSYGYRSGLLPADSLNCIARISNTSGTLPIVSAVKFLQRSGFPVMGWRTDTAAAYGLDERGGSAFASIWKSGLFRIGKRFTIRRLRFPISSNGPIANESLTPTIYTDLETNSTALRAVNTTNFVSGETLIDYQDIDVQGRSDFHLSLAFDATTGQPASVLLPITVDLEIHD